MEQPHSISDLTSPLHSKNQKKGINKSKKYVRISSDIPRTNKYYH